MSQIREIPMQGVEGSSTIAAVGHDPITQTLRVRFHKGTTYRYQNVTAELMAQLQAGESFGKAFKREVVSQPGLYPYMKES